MDNNKTLALLGLQWGDEGKGKIIDYLAQKFDVIARYQGGPNAGHTVYWQDFHFAFHQVPSGILNPKTVCIIGRGCVVDLGVLKEELEQLTQAEIDFKNRLFIDSKAHLILPYHKALDNAREKAKGKDKIGTTIRGIGPCYEDKYSRIGIRFGDLQDDEVFLEKLKRNLAQKNFLLMELHNDEPLSEKQIGKEFIKYAEFFKDMIIDGSDYINTAYEQGKKILFEGAQGTLLDIDSGTYPFVTSSSPTAGGVCNGIGIGPTRIDDLIGVAKAYTTRVGMGPFPTELFDDTGLMLQKQGSEFGATTGRARRCGWFDAPLVRYTARINGIKQLALTKLDVLDRFENIYIGIGYRYKDEKTNNFNVELTGELKPEFLKMEGWRCSTKTAKSFDDLPKPARKYLDKIQELTNCEISILSIGEQRDQTIISPNFKW
ncbi:MAG: adenylosuccinate synthase [Candidatus Latescibacteria bacterium]|nr:adenylosuccinate synthase [Candidatus Latescibacterota bacterium]